MTTAEIIENISDPGQFEELVNSILRKQNQEYNSIISTGRNSQGKPIKSIHDAFCQVPGSDPPKFIMVQSTTTRSKDLEKKWLYDGANKYIKQGDVIKSGKNANKIRKDFPNAKFILILATNRSLSLATKKDDSLYLKIQKKCKDFGISCDIWEQSRICDYLDNNSDGHWLRKKYLGINAELLSDSLFKDICFENLKQYKSEYSINDDFSYPRQYDFLTEGEIKKSKYVLHFLVGESGFGKSTISFKILKKQIDGGGYGLWIPASFFEELESLDYIISKTVNKIFPTIEKNSGEKIWDLCKRKGRFLIIVDDVNRVINPDKIINKLISLTSRFRSKYEDISEISPFIIICPIWPKLWTQFAKALKNNLCVNIIEIDKYSIEEAEAIIVSGCENSNYPITKLNANQLAVRLGCDPFLIHSFLESLKTAENETVDCLENNVIENFIESIIINIDKRSRQSFLLLEYRKTLEILCYHMLNNKQFLPSFEIIENWFKKEDPKHIQILKELVNDKTLCKFDENVLFFRHDRIRFHLLTRSMSAILEQKSDIQHLISEPYYAEILGQALLVKELDNEKLKQIQKNNILALAEAFKRLGDPKTIYQKNILNLFNESISIIAKKRYRYSSLLEAICWVLINTDSNDVISISKPLNKFYLIKFARVRNGDLVSGIDLCSNLRQFAPALFFPFRDQIFEHVKEKHSMRLRDQLKEILESDNITDKERYGALIFTGFLKLSDLREEILICWKKSQNKEIILPSAIWAGINCCEENPQTILDPIFEYWSNMPNTSVSGQLSKLQLISDELRLALMIKRSLPPSIVNYLISKSEKYESLQWSINNLLYVIDDPDALEYIISKSSDFFSTSFIREVWDYKRQPYGQKLSLRSLNRLESIWSNTNNKERCRKNAFHLWKTAVEIEELTKLQKILPDSILFKDTVLLRAELKDLTVIPDYLELISQKSYYLYVAHHLWNEKIVNVVEKYLESFRDTIPKNYQGRTQDDHYHLSSLLMAIPTDDAEQLLQKYWDHLGFNRIFIQTALYIGSSITLSLAEIAIKNCPKDVDIFEHIAHRFWINDQGRQRTISIARLNNLLPYLDRFTKRELTSLASACESCRFTEWGWTHLSPLLSMDENKYCYPSDNNVIQFFKEAAGRKGGLSDIKSIWLEKFERQGISKDRLLIILDKMLDDDNSFKIFQIVALCLKVIGNRKDLDLLSKYEIHGPENKISDLKTDVKFQVYLRSLE